MECVDYFDTSSFHNKFDVKLLKIPDQPTSSKLNNKYENIHFAQFRCIRNARFRACITNISNVFIRVAQNSDCSLVLASAFIYRIYGWSLAERSSAKCNRP